jgi:serine/threonine protein phosphatase 1
MKLGAAATPPGMRLYAVGDVHGADHLLADVHRKIEADLSAAPPSTYRIIHLGDYVDRGPNTAGVVQRLVDLVEADPRVTCLAGNHEDVLLSFLEDPFEVGEAFLRFGGAETMRSYGMVAAGTDLTALRDDFLTRIPPAHLAFWRKLPFSLPLGDYFFCHAGIRPGVPLDRQDNYDLMWIRRDFLDDDRDHGAVIIHGHTPGPAPDVRPNRINIDTKAYASGRLTCLVLEGRDYRFL